MLARLRELAALVLDLMEQSRVLDRDDRLRGEGLQQINRALWEIRPGFFRRTTQRADDPVGARAMERSIWPRKPARTITSSNR